MKKLFIFSLLLFNLQVTNVCGVDYYLDDSSALSASDSDSEHSIMSAASLRDFDEEVEVGAGGASALDVLASVAEESFSAEPTRGADGRFYCNSAGCGRSYKTMKSVREHMQGAHGEGFICREIGCGERFENCTSLREHNIKEHGDGFVCRVDDCGEKFGSSTSLSDHKTSAHGAGFICSIADCGERFENRTSLRNHNTKDHGDGIVCRDCGNKYRDGSGLRKHLKKCRSGGGAGAGAGGGGGAGGGYSAKRGRLGN